jgi:3-methylfumaryl-CoA hydratase
VDRRDSLSPEPACNLAAALDSGDTFTEGTVLPLLWQWLYFLDWPNAGDLGADGHPRNGHFLPPIPHRRRMFAGSRIEQHRPLRLGSPATKHTSLARIQPKTGRTGDLLFVTERSEYRQDGDTALVEEQNLVYRSDIGSTTSFTRSSEPLPPPTAPWTTELHPDTALLFRFSALTANAHRIHYDHPYTTGTEGYPGLVVHGPLLAAYMAELCRRRSDDKTLRSFEFRLRQPVILEDRFRVEGTPTPNSAGVELAITSGGGRVHATATGTYT